jgi:hypothetical protein
MNSSGVMSETIADFGLENGTNIYGTSGNFVSLESNYSGRNLILMGGLIKNWGQHKAHFGFGILLGHFIAFTPDMKGSISSWVYTSSGYNTVNYNFIMRTATQNHFIFEFNLHENISPSNHSFICTAFDFMASGFKIIHLPNYRCICRQCRTRYLFGRISYYQRLFCRTDSLSIGVEYNL